MDLKVKFPGDIAGIDPRIVQSDIEHGDGYVLHVFTPIPLEAAPEAAFKFPFLISKLIDL